MKLCSSNRCTKYWFIGRRGRSHYRDHEIGWNDRIASKNECSGYAVSRETLVVDWKPTNSGLQWVKVTIDNQQAESAKVDVKELEPEGFMDGVFQQANPALLGFSIVGASLLGLLCLMWLRLVTYTRGYGDEAEYYDEEDFIDDDDDFDDEEEV